MADDSDHVIVTTEDELSRVQRTFKKVAPQCSLKKRARGNLQLAPQQKQISILKHELEETLLHISIAKQRRNENQIAHTKRVICKSVREYEKLLIKLRHEKAQQTELDILNYLANKHVIDLNKEIPSESDEIDIFERLTNSLRRMENRLDLVTKRLSSINTDNKAMRDEISRLLIERRTFNTQWKQAISKLVKGRDYLMDIYEEATAAFARRDEYCRKLEVLKWKGLFQLNKDIADMQYYKADLNHLVKLEEFLRVKCSRRICEADIKEELQRQEEIAKCDQEIAKCDALLQQALDFAGKASVVTVIKPFRENEIKNSALFNLLCEMLQESNLIRKELDITKQMILDTKDEKAVKKEKQIRHIEELKRQLAEKKERTQYLRDQNLAAEAKLGKAIDGVDELVRISNCDVTPMLKLLGKKLANQYTVHRYLNILELEVKSLVQTVCGAVQPPPPTSKGQRKGSRHAVKKIVPDPYVEIIRPNKIEKLVNYVPCAYCVEDYLMNLVFETPAVPADNEYIQRILHLDKPNTKFGIYTLTIEGRRHMKPDANIFKDN